MSWGSRVPEIVDGLVQRFADAMADDAAFAGVEVRDGPELASTSRPEALNVGYTGLEGEMDIEGGFVREGLADERESLTVRCAATVIRGDTRPGPARARAYAVMGAAGVALAQDRTLGGMVLRAGIGSHSLICEQTSNGVEATVIFAIDCDTYAVR